MVLPQRSAIGWAECTARATVARRSVTSESSAAAPASKRLISRRSASSSSNRSSSLWSSSADREVVGSTAVYRVTGELFFASSNDLYTQFEYADDPDRVVIDLTASHVWDASTVAALDAITTKYERKGKSVEIIGLNDSSAERHERLTGQLAAH